MAENPFLVMKPLGPEGSKGAVEDKRDFFKHVSKIISDITDTGLSIDKKLDYVIKLNGFLLTLTFRELLADTPREDLMKGAARVTAILKEISASLVNQLKLMESQEINPTSKKFQLAFIWFMQVFREVLEEYQVDSFTVDSIFNELSVRLSGWEETLVNRLKGLSPWAFDDEMSKNPFKKFPQAPKKSG
jgi:hypothetical protein